MRRPLWLATGVVLGVSGTLWAEQRVRKGAERLVERLSAEQLALSARRSAGAVGARVRNAVDVARDERDRREEELWADLEGTGAPRRATGGTERRRDPATSGRRGSH